MQSYLKLIRNNHDNTLPSTNGEYDIDDENDLIPEWDQQEPERLLAEARAALATAEDEHQAGRMSVPRLAAVRTWLEVAEEYVHNQEREADRGWDVLKLIRSAVGHATGLVKRKVSATASAVEAEHGVK